MSLLDRLTGTRYPADGVARLPTMELRSALLGINGTGVPFAVRNARPSEKAGLVAEWRMLEPAVGSSVTRKQLERTHTTLMRLIPSKREVRTIVEQREVTWTGVSPRLATSRKYGRGPQITTVSWEWTYEHGADGRR
ncbi:MULTISPECIES: hypothetical protein [Streptomyces]|uniref:hypothetical protein n=1 Tax=Streptomyces TaxID=1883 RepID=UPI0014887FC6|nr:MULTISPECIES: hypothetical protein [Streptomyces]